MSDIEEEGAGTVREQQAWVFANLDTEECQWTRRMEDELGIFWNFHKYGPGYPYRIYPDFDIIDLMVQSPLEWPRHTVFADEVDIRLEMIRRAEGCYLSKIPTELHLRLFEYLGYVDALCLTHTCRYFWVTGHYRLVQLVNSAQPSWAGDRLLCVGNLAKGLPSSIDFPEWILREINEYIGENPESGELKPLFEIIEEGYPEIYGIAQMDYQSLSKSSPTAEVQMGACISQAESFGQPDDPIRRELLTWSRHLRSFPLARDRISTPNREWALRNLDTGEYVTLKGIAMNPSRIVGTSSRNDQIDLLSVLLYRNTWSTVDKTGSKYQGLHQGPWAGHRFDVLPVDRILGDKSKAWKDISKEVREELYNIAVSDGKEWAEAYKRGDPIDCQALRDAS